MAKSFFSSDIKIDGDIRSTGDIEIDGAVKGKIQAVNVKLLAAGQFDGQLTCDGLTVDGRVAGTVQATDIAVSGTGVVNADVVYSTISSSKGAKIQGNLKVK